MSNITKVYTTSNYGMFRVLNGNRPVTRSRLAKVRDGIKSVGQIVPIIVNEKLEVIDGQARLEACKSLNIPIDYVVKPGLGVEACRNTNTTSSVWTAMNYVNSYAESGSTDYRYLDLLLKRFRALGTQDVISAVVGRFANVRHVKDGSLQCSETRYVEATEALTFEESLLNVLKTVNGRTDLYKHVLGFCCVHPLIDNGKLFSQMTKYRISLVPISTVEQALNVVENIYNRNARDRIYIATEYKRMLDKHMTWYEYRDFINQGVQ